MAARFTTAAAILAVLGCLLAVGTAVLVRPSAAFAGSVGASGLVGLAFAIQGWRLLRRSGRPWFPPAAVTAVFGVWFVLAPLRYDAGFLATAGTQLAGLLTAAFAGYLALEAIDPAGPTPAE